MHVQAHLRSAAAIIELYHGQMPLAAFLKKHFAANKKFGSKDRKNISQLCYNYFRTGSAWANASVTDKMLLGQFLANAQHPYADLYPAAWKDALQAPVTSKLHECGLEPHDIFPHLHLVSPDIDAEGYVHSLLAQPDVFIRIRPGRATEVLQKLDGASITYTRESEYCLRLPQGIRLQEVLEVDKEAVVQDASSQQVLQAYTQRVPAHPRSAWDCCAASGGKSILLHDSFPQTSITATDIRESIIANLKKRFLLAGIKNFEALVRDVAGEGALPGKKFDLVICDVPCSGSGTWARTPEQAFYFRENQLEHYTSLQQRISTQAARTLAPGRHLLYITCSVFGAENEAAVRHLQQHAHLQLVDQHYIQGYHLKADTMFAALFKL